MRNVLTLLLVISVVFEVLSQSGPSVVQPTIMVIPFVKQNQNLRYVYERDELARIAVTKVKEGFDSRDVTTIDLVGKLKQMNNTDVLASEQRSDMKDEVIKLSGADIYVEVEANKNFSSSGNSVTVILKAIDAYSGEALANKVVNSPKFYTDNFEKLVSKAVESEIENFLDVINSKFMNIVETGRTVTITIGILDGSEADMDMEVGEEGLLLSEDLEEWMVKTAYKEYAHLQGSTSNKLIFDIVKIPIRTDSGRPYRVSSFAGKLRNYVKSLGFEADRVINGNSIVVTIQ